MKIEIFRENQSDPDEEFGEKERRKQWKKVGAKKREREEHRKENINKLKNKIKLN